MNVCTQLAIGTRSLISLELGGDPNGPRNLWVEPPSDTKPRTA
jgi:hypothetical protein